MIRRRWPGRIVIASIVVVSAVLATSTVRGWVDDRRWTDHQRALPNSAPAPKPADLRTVEIGAHVEALPDAPFGSRDDPAGVWTGTELIIWGGVADRAPANDGAAYNPGTRTWRTLAAAPLPARSRHLTVWSGTEMLVWGGTPERSGIGGLLDGAAYNPITDAWRPIAAAPEGTDRSFGNAVWVEGRLAIAGGWGPFGDQSGSLLLYDPAGDRWRVVHAGPVRDVVPLGSKLIGLAADVDRRVAELVIIDPATGHVTDFVPFPVGVEVTRMGIASNGDRVAVAVNEQTGSGYLGFYDFADRRWTHLYDAGRSLDPPIEMRPGALGWPFAMVDQRLVTLHSGLRVVDPTSDTVADAPSIGGLHDVSPTAVTVWTGREWLTWGRGSIGGDVQQVGVGARITLG